VKRAWILAVLTVASVTGLGYVHPFGNPRVEAARGLGTLLQGAKLPPDAKAVLVTKCADCHSSETRWPVYARVAAAVTGGYSVFFSQYKQIVPTASSHPLLP
jgi:cytochrome c